MIFQLPNLLPMVLTTTLWLLYKATSLKINNAYSTFSDILYGVPQDSILRPLLFKIYISDMFYDIDKCDLSAMLTTAHNTPVILT